MCKDCIRTLEPERDKTTLNNGSYFLNYKGCAQCKNIGIIKIIDKSF